MAYSITLTDERYARLQAASQLYHQTPEQVIDTLLNGLPLPMRVLSDEEYDRQWGAFMQVVGSIKHGKPLTNEEIDELIGEEAAETHGGDTIQPGISWRTASDVC